MAAQYRLIKRLAVADSPVQVGNGKYNIKMIVLIAGAAAAAATVRDEADTDAATDPVAEERALTNEAGKTYFDHQEGGGLRLSAGCYLTLAGAGSVLYVYGA